MSLVCLYKNAFLGLIHGLRLDCLQPPASGRFSKLHFWSLGDICLYIEPNYENVLVLKVKYHAEQFNDAYLSLEDVIQSDTIRNMRIRRMVSRILLDAGRKVLVLTLRRQHATCLHELIRNRC